MIGYTTLFDAAYAARGCTMIDSLKAYGPDAVYVLALDERTEVILERRYGDTGNVITVGLDEFLSANEHVRTALAKRPWKHFCWSLASIWTRYVYNHDIRGDGESAIVYVDADCMFFSDPAHTLHELIKHAPPHVGLVPHHFPETYAHYCATSGFYNVNFAVFTGTKDADEAMDQWVNAVITKCDDETCGDQKHLDAYRGMAYDFAPHVSPGPWCVWNHDLRTNAKGRVELDRKPLVLMHYHEHQRTGSHAWRRTKGYPLREVDIEILYKPYEAVLLRVADEIGVDLALERRP